MMRSKWLMAASLCLCCALACDGKPEPTELVPKLDRPPKSKPAAFGPRLSLPEGTFVAGTVPGQFDRNPELEPATREQRLGGYAIDRHPWRDPGGAEPRRVASADVAAQHCRSRQGRLCTELEWERACKGPESLPFSTGAEWKPGCAGDGSCKTNYGMRAMGSEAEWTASDFGPDTPQAGQPVLRGAGGGAATNSRCASRRTRAQLQSRLFTFRCCYGAPNAARVEEGQLRQAYGFAQLSQKQLRALLREHPKTEPLAETARFFEPASVGKVLAAAQDDKKGFEFTTKPLLWNPIAGADFLIVLGTSKGPTSFVLAYHVLSEGRYSLSSSFLIHKDAGPFVLAYSESIRLRAHFTGCWGCPGETGKVIYRKPDRAVVVQP